MANPMPDKFTRVFPFYFIVAISTAFLSWLTSCATGPLPSTQEPVVCVVDASNPESGRVRVEMELPSTLAGSKLSFFFPYSKIEDFGYFTAVVDGREIKIVPHSILGSPDFSLPEYRLTAAVRYELDPLFFVPGEKRTGIAEADSKLNGTAGIFRTSVLFGKLPFSAPFSIRFRLPKDWTVVAPWQKSEDVFFADEMNFKVYEYVGIGPFAIHEISTESSILTVGVYPGTVKLSEETMSSLLGFLTRQFGLPAKKNAYSAFVAPFSFIHGGIAGTRSFATIDNPVTFLHELLHMYNDSWKTDNGAAWFHEGFTEYAACMFALKANAVTESFIMDCFADLNGEMRLLESSGGVSLVTASLLMKKDFRMNRLVYAKGALFALWAERRLAESGRSLADFMGTVFKYSGPELKTSDLRAIIKKLYGETLLEGFDSYVTGSLVLPDLGLSPAAWKTGFSYFHPGNYE
jgi:hypothetical protein